MNVPQEELNAWAQAALHVNGLLLAAQDALRRGDVTEAGEKLTQARQVNWTQEKRLVRAGADDPIAARAQALEQEMTTEEVSTLPQPQETSLALLTSPANRRLLEALRAAQEAAEAVDRERGDWPEGLAEVLAEYVAQVELEVHGPKGLRSWE
ncbi:MAG TPA: hypothetical protein VFB38_02290 [Chthonomonadaceae bacterium]|nr:hypothetical protein [Chthonomonadaceae bacterium]